MHIIRTLCTSRHKFSSCAVLEQYIIIANPFGRHTDFKVVITHLSHGTEPGPTASNVTKHRVFILHCLFVLCANLFAPQHPMLFVEWTGLWFIGNLFHMSFFFSSHSAFAHVQLALSGKSEPTATLMQLWIWLKFDMWGRWFCTFQ